MKNVKRVVVVMLALGIGLGTMSCKKDDNKDSGTNPTPPTLEEQVAGTWLSADDNVAPILQGDPFNYDSVMVTFTDMGVVTLKSHVRDGDWTQAAGVFDVTKSASGDIHAIHLNYTAFEQEGIFQITTGSPDNLKLEAVQTVPDYGFTVPTPENGFGADPVYQEMNIQMYVRQ